MDRRSSTLYPREDSRLFRSSNFVGVVANENQEVVNLTEQPPDVVRLLKPHIGNNRNMLTVADMIRIVLLYGRKEKKNEKLKKVIEKLERSLRKLKYLLLVAVLLILGLTSGLAFVIVYKVGNKIDDTKDTVLSRSGVMMMKEESVEVSTKSHGIIVGDDGGFVDSDGKEIICMSSEKVQQLFVANAEGTPTKIVSSVGTGLNVRSLDVPGSNSEWNNRFTQIGNIKFVPNLECINIVNENNSDGIIRNEANRGGNDTILDGAGRSLTEERLLYHHQKLQEIVAESIILRGQEPKTNNERRQLALNSEFAYGLFSSTDSENESASLTSASIPTSKLLSSCVDSIKLKYNNNENKNCDWVASEDIEIRCKKTWEGKKLYDYCPLTCLKKGLGCCVDNSCSLCVDNNQLKYKNDESKNCDWVASKDVEKRCKKNWEGKKLYDFCPWTCLAKGLGSCVEPEPTKMLDFLGDGNSHSRGKCQSLMDVVCESGSFTLFCDALKDADIDMKQFEEKSWTFFIPNDEAFGHIGSVLEPLSKEQLTNIVMFHVVADQILMSDDLECKEEIEMLNGKNSRTKCKYGGTLYQSGFGNNEFFMAPQIIQTDIKFCNGVAHVLDGVMLPPKYDVKRDTDYY